MVLSFILIQNRQGKTRLAKWYAPYSDAEKVKLKGEVHRLIAPRDQKHQSNFVEFRSMKIVYRRYAGLFFCACVDANDNELAYLEAIHFFVEVLDAFFWQRMRAGLGIQLLQGLCYTGRGLPSRRNRRDEQASCSNETGTPR